MSNLSRFNDPATPSSSAARRHAAAAQTDQADRRLIGRIVEKDRDAFRELYLDYHRRLTRFLSRLMRNPADAEEIVNDTLWIVWTKAPEFRGASRVSTWIFGIAYRRSLKKLRTVMRYERVIQRELLESDIIAHVDSKASEEQQALRHALAQLTTDQRLVMEFAYFLGHSCAEIAEIVGAPVNTVKSRMLHARKKLQSILAKENQIGASALCLAQV
jgi:RNA polymerase sigma-70 factor (ECF subfamily)